MRNVLLADKVKQVTMLVMRTTRRIVQLLLITLVINAGGWTFNKEAVADVWFDEQRSQAVSDGHSSIVIIFSCFYKQIFFPKFADQYFIQQPLTIQFLSPEERFRPPRLLS